MSKTISFCQGKGNVNHNNRKFITPNVDRDRTEWNITFCTETLQEAYDKCFGEAINEYNAKQKRKDRMKTNYLEEIQHSKNGEHDFYEDIVQIGTMNDTPVIDENGNLTDEAAEAIEILKEYANTFQERNPNLYLFNCVMHLDEKTPHLHIDYIPVAEGYTQGLEKRNSISKALQCMGIPKALSKNENEEHLWKNREREYIKGLCNDRGIEIHELGEKRDNYTLPEYKEIMEKVELLKEQNIQANERLEGYLQNIEIAQKSSEKARKEIQKIENEVTDIPKIFGKEEYVKVPKKTWMKVLKYCEIGLQKDNIKKIVEETTTNIKNVFEKELKATNNEFQNISRQFKSVLAFITDQGMISQYEEYARPKTVHERLHAANEKIGRFGTENQKEKKQNRNQER